MKSITDGVPTPVLLEQRFSTGGTRTPRGTSAVAKGYAGKNIVTKYFMLKQIGLTQNLIIPPCY